jgi:hypothetical protein
LRSGNRSLNTVDRIAQKTACNWQGKCLEFRSFALRPTRREGNEEGRKASVDGAFQWSRRVGKLKKPVDETKKVLHNLVSLLLTQQRGESKALLANVL